MLLKILLYICAIAVLIYLTWALFRLFMKILISIKKKDHKSLVINSLIFIVGLVFYLKIINPIGQICFIYKDIIKAF